MGEIYDMREAEAVAWCQAYNDIANPADEPKWKSYGVRRKPKQ